MIINRQPAGLLLLKEAVCVRVRVQYVSVYVCQSCPQMKCSCNCNIIENDFFGLLPVALLHIALVKQFASL